MSPPAEPLAPTPSAAEPSPLAARIEVFGFDVAEISQIRRIRAMRALGHRVHSFTMRRANMNRDFQPDWPNTHLFETENEKLLRRVGVVAAAILKVALHGKRLRRADLIVARNLDMLAIAAAGRWLARAGRVPLVYECLDIHGALCDAGAKGRLMRAAERFLLRRCQMLIVSSPGFIRHYFDPLQGYRGAWMLWENKLAAGVPLPQRPVSRLPAKADAPLRLGWVGTIRCAPSLALLSDLARAMGPRLQIHIHGVVHHHALPEFAATLAAHPNMIFHGAYGYPQDLARIYGDCDLVWAQDLWQRGTNSDWLLPNRIYEASWAGCPSLAVADTETGRRIEADGLGWTISGVDARALQRLLDSLGRDQIAARARALLARPAEDFVQSPREIEALIDRLIPPRPAKER